MTIPHHVPQGREPSGSDIHHPKAEPGLPNCCQHESRQLCRIPPHRGPSPRDSSRHYPRPEPGLQDYCQHESMKPCRIPPHRGPSPREVTDIILGRNQGFRITVITVQGTRNFGFSNPIDHAACYQKCASPREATDITPSRNQGSPITASTNPIQPCPTPPQGREPSG